jgi:hypothetical protein
MYEENNENFSFDGCSFVTQKSKESCGRVVMFKEFNILYSYTLESSFCGPTRGAYDHCHFNTAVLEKVGQDFCGTLYDLSVDLERVNRVHQDLQIRYPVNAAPVVKKYDGGDDNQEE